MRIDPKDLEALTDHIVKLQAAQAVGQSSKELICRHYNQRGYTVLHIGKAEKRAVVVDLDKLFGEETHT